MAFQSRRIYRICHRRFPAFDGGGAYRFGSRWVSPGRQVIHAASTYSLAVLENIVHTNSASIAKEQIYITAPIRDTISQDSTRITGKKLLDQAACRKIGDKWFDSGEHLVLWVPSVISPFEQNVLINQTHEEFKKLRPTKAQPAVIDARLYT